MMELKYYLELGVKQGVLKLDAGDCRYIIAKLEALSALESQLAAARAEIAALKALIIEADAQFNTDREPATIEAAELALVRMCSMGRQAMDENAALREDKEQATDALQKICAWAEAYPLEIFPEPDFKLVRKALEAYGISLDCVSASNMRHVITKVAQIAIEGLIRHN